MRIRVSGTFTTEVEVMSHPPAPASQPLTIADIPTIVQAVLNALPQYKVLPPIHLLLMKRLPAMLLVSYFVPLVCRSWFLNALCNCQFMDE